MSSAAKISKVSYPRNLAVSTTLAKMATFSDPVALRVPRQTLRKITSGRKACPVPGARCPAPGVVVGRRSSETHESEGFPAFPRAGEEALAQSLDLGELQRMGAREKGSGKNAAAIFFSIRWMASNPVPFVSNRDEPFRSKCLHDPQGGEGIVGGVAQLRGAELRAPPIAGGDRFGFLEAQLEDRSHRPANADLLSVTQRAEDLIEIEDVVERNPQSTPNLFPIILQSKAHLKNPVGGNELGGRFLALAVTKLKDESFIRESELHHVRTVAFFSRLEGGPGLGVESAKTCGKDFIGRLPAFVSRLRHVDLFRGKSYEGG